MNTIIPQLEQLAKSFHLQADGRMDPLMFAFTDRPWVPNDPVSRYITCRRDEVRKGKVPKDLILDGNTLKEAIEAWLGSVNHLNLDNLDEQLIRKVQRMGLLFIKKFYSHCSIFVSNPKLKRKDFADKCKQAESALRSILEDNGNPSQEDCEIVLLYQHSDGPRVIPLESLHYIPNSDWTLIKFREESDPQVVLTFKKAEGSHFSLYSPLFKAMIEVQKALLDCESVQGSSDVAYKQLIDLAQSIDALGRLYGCLNPSDEEMDEFEEKAIECLTELDKGGPNYEYHGWCSEHWKGLVNDLEYCITVYKRSLLMTGKSRSNFINNSIVGKVYCWPMAKAIARVRNLNFKYEDKHIYISNKASSMRNRLYKRLQKAFQKCIFECDPLIDEYGNHILEMDEVIGYNVRYITKEQAEKIGTTILTSIAREIYNPSKFKPRIIHIGCNAVQDRCKFIHCILASVLQDLSCKLNPNEGSPDRTIGTDCTKFQRGGVLFILDKTNPENAFDEDGNRRYNLYTSDFSNATDTLSQYCQEQTLGLFLPKCIVDAWHYFSTMPKYIKFRTKDDRFVTQNSGQPQGLLGSFDAFALHHHMVMLLTMRSFCNREGNFVLRNHRPDEFYRILGDDSAICSIVPDIPPLREELYETNDLGQEIFKPVPDKHGVLGNYLVFCKWSNWQINFSKTTIVDGSIEDRQLIEFAKVTVRNGEYFSPIPTRLFLGNDYSCAACILPPAIWKADHDGYNNIEYLRKLVKERHKDIPESFIDTIFFSGIIPAFAGLKSPEVDIDYERDFDPIYSYLKSSIQINILMGCVSDFRKESLITSSKTVSLDKAWFSELFDKGAEKDLNAILDIIELPFDHKVFGVMTRNQEIADILKNIWKGNYYMPENVVYFTDRDISDKMISVLQKIARIEANRDHFSYNLSVLTDKQDLDMKSLLDQITEWDSFVFRSSYKRAKFDALILTNAYNDYNEFLQGKAEM